MGMKKRHYGESEEIGWISMVDLLVVIACIGLFVVASVIGVANSNRTAAQSAEAKVKTLEDENGRLVKQIGDWTVAATEAERKYRELVGVVSKDGSDAATLGEKLAGALSALKAAEAKAAAAQADAKSSQDEMAGMKSGREEMNAKLDRAKSDLEEAKRALASATSENRRINDVMTSQDSVTKKEGEVKKDLLGINGGIGNVVFVVDRSESMRKGGRWDDAKRTIQNWVTHLPVNRAALVLFGSNIEFIPPVPESDGPLRPDTREIPVVDDSLRTLMRQELEGIKPAGSTPTYAALRRSMDFKDIDAIILFTDGNPDPTSSGGDPRAEVEQLVIDWRQMHPNAHVHVVGIGDYFNESMRQFLLGVAKAGDGAFIGR
jgi:Mg-chelatase subunit ChlD